MALWSRTRGSLPYPAIPFSLDQAGARVADQLNAILLEPMPPLWNTMRGMVVRQIGYLDAGTRGDPAKRSDVEAAMSTPWVIGYLAGIAGAAVATVGLPRHSPPSRAIFERPFVDVFGVERAPAVQVAMVTAEREAQAEYFAGVDAGVAALERAMRGEDVRDLPGRLLPAAEGR